LISKSFTPWLVSQPRSSCAVGVAFPVGPVAQLDAEMNARKVANWVEETLRV
jgi:hypothetical protein